MANRDLLKEAIADAKSVKEAAIANAKAALEEAFTPYLKEKFTAKLAEMEIEEEEIDEAKEEVKEIDEMEETEKEMEESYSEDKMEEKMSDPVMRHGLKGDDAEELATEKDRYKGIDGDKMDEMDLDELLAELEEEMKLDENLDEESRAERADVDRYEFEKGKEEGEDEEKGEEDDEEIDLEDMTEDELKELIEDVIADMVKAGELEAGENYEEEGEEDVDVDVDVDTEEVNEAIEDDMMEEGVMDKIKGMSEDMLMKLFGVKTPSELLQALGNAAGAAKRMEEEKGEEIDEMKKEIEELASTLSEVKLLNAKLLYSNKIFRAKNLTETQKVKVLEAFDKANSVNDAKLIYETLTAVKETKSPVTESMKGMASKAMGVAPEKKPIFEVNDQFARWQILAGIKKNN